MEAKSEITTTKSAWGKPVPVISKKDVIDEVAVEYMARRMVEGIPISMKEYNEELKTNWTVRQLNHQGFMKTDILVSRPSKEFMDVLRRKLHKISNGLVAVQAIGGGGFRSRTIGFLMFRRSSQEEPFDLEDYHDKSKYGSSSGGGDDDDDEAEEDNGVDSFNSLKILIQYKGKDDNNPTFMYKRGKNVVE